MIASEVNRCYSSPSLGESRQPDEALFLENSVLSAGLFGFLSPAMPGVVWSRPILRRTQSERLMWRCTESMWGCGFLIIPDAQIKHDFWFNPQKICCFCVVLHTVILSQAHTNLSQKIVLFVQILESSGCFFEVFHCCDVVLVNTLMHCGHWLCLER